MTIQDVADRSGIFLSIASYEGTLTVMHPMRGTAFDAASSLEEHWATERAGDSGSEGVRRGPGVRQAQRKGETARRHVGAALASPSSTSDFRPPTLDS